MFKKTNIGIDLGKREIKIVVIRNLNEIFSLQHKEKYIVNEDIDYFIFLKNCIKDFTKKNKINKAEFSFSIPPNSPLNSIKFLSYSEDKRIENAIQLDFEKNGDNLEDTYLRYGITSENKEAEVFEILSVLIEKNIIESLKKIGNLKWNIVNIEPQIITLGRIITDNSVVIDMGYENTRMYAYMDGKPTDSRIIEVGGKNVFKTIMDNHFDLKGLSTNNKKEEAMKLIKDSCYLTEELKGYFEGDMETSEIIHYDVDRLAKETIQNIRSFETMIFNPINKDIDNIYIIGGLGELQYYKDILKNMLGMNVEHIHFISYETEEVENEDYQYTIAGLTTMHNTSNYTKSFNYVKINTFKFNYKVVAVGLIAITICMQLAMKDIHKKYNTIITETEIEMEKQQQIIDEIKQEVQKESLKVKRFQDLTSTIDGINNQKKWFSDILYALPEETPLGIALTKLQIKDGQVAMEGLSADYTNLGFLAIGLEKYGEVDIKAIKNGLDNDIYLKNNDISSISFKMEKAFNILFTHNGKILEHNEDLTELKSPETVKNNSVDIEYIEKHYEDYKEIEKDNGEVKEEKEEKEVVEKPVEKTAKKIVENPIEKQPIKPTPKLVEETTVELEIEVEEEVEEKVIEKITEPQKETSLEEVLNELFEITP